MRTLKWFSSDYAANFRYNYKEYPLLFKRYKDTPIEYTLNSHEFRTDFEFKRDKRKKVDIFLGCSHTFGVGHYVENTWPYFISKHTGNKVMNLAMAGTGAMNSFYYLLKYIDFYKVQNVFHFQPVYSRYDYFRTPNLKNREGQVLLVHSPNHSRSISNVWNKDYEREILLSDSYMYFNHVQNIMAIQGLCAERNIPYFYSHRFPYIPNFTDEVAIEDGKLKVVGDIDLINKHHIVARDGTHEPRHFHTLLYMNYKRYMKEFPQGKMENIPYYEEIYPKTTYKPPFEHNQHLPRKKTL